MVSYAAPGGGVGPHVDSYDVFLLQGPGRRRWSVNRKRRWTLDPKAPLKILRNFRAERSWVLEPGDMLYLPPGWAHEGVALEPCYTYSIGFRAPSDQEIAREFLAFLQDRVDFHGQYADPGMSPQRHPAEIPARMVRRAVTVARSIRWRDQDVARFLGEFLSTPKPQVVFSRPTGPRSLRKFAALCRAREVRLDPRTLMLFHGRDFFINGERVDPPVPTRTWLKRFADERTLPPPVAAPLLRLLHPWYLSGWIRIGDPRE